MKLRHLILPLGITLVATSAITMPPTGTGNVEPVSVSVRYSDLDLSTIEGTAQLEARLARAARKACAQPGRSLHELAFERKCRREALEGGRAAATPFIARAKARAAGS